MDKSLPKLLIGDYCIVLLGIIISVVLFNTLWHSEHAAKIQIRQGNQILGTYSLNLTREIEVKGAIGPAHIAIAQGRVRFTSAPCSNQYCVHQGWLSRAGQAAICLPNQLSIELIGKHQHFDTLNY